MSKITSAPGLYDAEFEMNVGSDGKPTLKIQDLDYVSDVIIGPAPAKTTVDSKPAPTPASVAPAKK